MAELFRFFRKQYRRHAPTKEELQRSPLLKPLGKRIWENVSKEAWGRWVRHQTMLINEYRLTPVDPKARKLLEGEMEKFFFGGGSQTPAEFKPEG